MYEKRLEDVQSTQKQQMEFIMNRIGLIEKAKGHLGPETEVKPIDDPQ